MRAYLLFCYFIEILCIGAYSAEINCHEKAPVKMRHLQICCKHPGGRDLIAEKCAKKIGIMNLPKPDDESVLAMSPEIAVIHRCFSECFFVENKFWIDGKLNMDRVRQQLTDKVEDKEYVKEMIASIDVCHSSAIEKRADVINKMQTTSNNKCDPMPGAILACAITQFFRKCPANRWLNTNECNNAREFLNKCETKLFAPGI